MPPEIFGDRAKELADLVTIIQQSVATNKIENAVICGERGFGKTSLLVKLVEECPVGCFSSFRALSSSESPERFAEATIQKMDIEYLAQLPKHESMLRSLAGSIEQVNVWEFGLAIRRQELTPENGLLQAILRFRGKKFKSLILFIDEADLLSKEILALLKNVIEEVRSRYSYPAAVFLSGKEDVTNKLTGKWSPIRRFYIGHIHKLTSFDLAGVKDALTKAGAKGGFSWSDEACNLVYNESSGHPFVVQIFGDRCEQKSVDKKINAEVVRKAKPLVIHDAWDWYKDVWTAPPSETEVRVLDKLAGLGGRASYSELKKGLRVPSIGTHLRRLVDKKILLQEKTSEEYYFPTKIIVDAIADEAVKFT